MHGLIAASLFALALPGTSGTALDTVQTAVTALVSVLEAEESDSPSASDRRRLQIRAVAERTFDTREMARRSLGPHWARRSTADQQQFVAAFADLLDHTYLRTVERYVAERITFAERLNDGKYADVRARVEAREGRDTLIDFRLHRRDANWRIYDVVVDGVSLISHYRAQFDRLIQSTSFAGLLQRLQQRSVARMPVGRLHPGRDSAASPRSPR